MVLTGGGGKDEAIALDVYFNLASGRMSDMVLASKFDFNTRSVLHTYLTLQFWIFPSHALLLMYLVSKCT